VIVARLPVPRGLVVPERILAASRSPQIDICSQDVPMGAQEWIGCCYATPHDDTHVGENDRLFVTLAVKAHHSLGDALSKDPALHLVAGDLFVVDPKVVHWLFAADAWHRTQTRPFIGLQWKVSKRWAAKRVAEIVRQCGGTWTDNEDPRYRRWRMATHAQADAIIRSPNAH